MSYIRVVSPKPEISNFWWVRTLYKACEVRTKGDVHAGPTSGNEKPFRNSEFEWQTRMAVIAKGLRRFGSRLFLYSVATSQLNFVLSVWHLLKAQACEMPGWFLSSY